MKRRYMGPLSILVNLALLAISTPLAGGSSVDPKRLTDPQKEEFLRTAPIVEVRRLLEGTTNSLRVTLRDRSLTHDAHVQSVDVGRIEPGGGPQSNFRDNYKFNVAAYRLDRMLELHMSPVCVEREVRGKPSAVCWWVDDVLMNEKQRYQKNIRAPNARAWNDQMYAIRIFDQLIYNTDRNLGNVLISKGWKVWMIDHTRAFRPEKSLFRPANIENVRCDRKLLAGLRTTDEEALRAELGDYLNEAQLDGLLARARIITEMIEQQIAERGEEAILYDLGQEP